MYRTVEEIRNKLSLSHTKFAKLIGISLRTYNNKLYGIVRNEWKVDDLYKIASFNDGKVRIVTDKGDYDIQIKAR